LVITLTHICFCSTIDRLLSRNSSNIQFIYAYDTHNIGPNRVVLLFITVQSKASVIPSSLIHRNPNTKIHKANFLFKIVYSGYAKRENAAPIKIKHREMQHLSSQMQQHEREWRRSKVLELSSQGHSEREIASTLQMHPTTVHRDLAFLRRQAQENLTTHIQERLPEQYQKCINGLNQVLKIGWNIVNSESSSPAIWLQGLALINDSYNYLMDLTTNGVVITDAIKYVQGQMDHLNKSEKALLQDIKQKEDKEPEQ
jgi:ribosomal protein L25 (general stress protein Ctc)